ncbi:MAG: histidine kinase [Sphingomonas bacterium]|uniref:oxygenase MpaB family protein n=1 Tax=Sphingomonas bacterium TaxID=1895847 RepID=UPI00261D4A84|nr:oxygenase MpaB family protein [Sphingomonas bacterium]MDB5695142.1 histidine kinase [Sphingomonas bacterium]
MRDTIRDEIHRLVGAGQMKLAREPGDPGLFGPGSVAWQVHGDFSAMMIGGVAALMTQMLHPGALAGVWDHSDWEKNPAGRLKRTAQFVAGTTYGPTALAHAQIARVRAVHEHVSGTLPDGTPYSATDPHLLTWVHVAEADCFLRAYIAYREPGMTGARQDRYLAEMAVLARLMGAGDVPESRRAMAAYFREIRAELRFDGRTHAVATALLGQPATNGATAPIQALLLQAGVELMQPWAATLHGRAVGTFSRPAIRFGANATAGVLRWALAARAPKAIEA